MEKIKKVLILMPLKREKFVSMQEKRRFIKKERSLWKRERSDAFLYIIM
jgi:hypothetical protein